MRGSQIRTTPEHLHGPGEASRTTRPCHTLRGHLAQRDTSVPPQGQVRHLVSANPKGWAWEQLSEKLWVSPNASCDLHLHGKV